MKTTQRHTLQEFDAALDFAYLCRREIGFCGKMVRVFELRGNLTPAQIHTLLSIRDGRRKK
jgi:hypothetical protein